MTFIIKSFLFILSGTLLVGNNECKLLPNGKYLIKYTLNPTQASSRINIRDKDFSQYFENGDSAKGKIEWIYDCKFILNCDSAYTKSNKDTSEVGRMLFGRGNPCFELDKTSGDTIFFKLNYLTSIEITVNEGEIIRVK